MNTSTSSVTTSITTSVATSVSTTATSWQFISANGRILGADEAVRVVRGNEDTYSLLQAIEGMMTASGEGDDDDEEGELLPVSVGNRVAVADSTTPVETRYGCTIQRIQPWVVRDFMNLDSTDFLQRQYGIPRFMAVHLVTAKDPKIGVHKFTKLPESLGKLRTSELKALKGFWATEVTDTRTGRTVVLGAYHSEKEGTLSTLAWCPVTRRLLTLFKCERCGAFHTNSAEAPNLFFVTHVYACEACAGQAEHNVRCFCCGELETDSRFYDLDDDWMPIYPPRGIKRTPWFRGEGAQANTIFHLCELCHEDELKRAVEIIIPDSGTVDIKRIVDLGFTPEKALQISKESANWDMLDFPCPDGHFTHWSRQAEGKLAYYPSTTAGLRQISPAKYIRTLIEGTVSDEEIQLIVADLIRERKGEPSYALRETTDPDMVEEVYTFYAPTGIEPDGTPGERQCREDGDGFNAGTPDGSCMRDAFSNLPEHPARMYVGHERSNLRLLYIMEPPKNGSIPRCFARTWLQTDAMTFGRIYATTDHLEGVFVAMIKERYPNARRAGYFGLDGGVLRLVPTHQTSVIMPYVDGHHRVTLVRGDDSHFVIDSKGTISADSTNGTITERLRCRQCGGAIPFNASGDSLESRLCQRCLDERYVCDECELEYFSPDGSNEYGLCNECFRRLYFQCHFCGEDHRRNQDGVVCIYDSRGDYTIGLTHESCCLDQGHTCSRCGQVMEDDYGMHDSLDPQIEGRVCIGCHFQQSRRAEYAERGASND